MRWECGLLLMVAPIPLAHTEEVAKLRAVFRDPAICDPLMSICCGG